MSISEQLYQDYYKKRRLTKDYYRDYQIPTYLKKVLPNNKNAHILDIGCGLGQLITALKEMDYTNVKGVDISTDIMLRNQDKKSNIELVRDIPDYCISENVKYDFIIMSHVLEHLDKAVIIDTLKLIRQNLMKDDASLLIMVPNAQSSTGCYWAYEDFTHHTLFTSGSIYFVLIAAGYESIRFVDPDGLDDSRIPIQWLKYMFLVCYKSIYRFMNWVTSSSVHPPSPQIFTYELKVLAKTN